MSCQQDELYAAESEVDLGDFISPSALQQYVDELRELPYYDLNFPMVTRIEAYHVPDRDRSIGSWNEAMGAGKIELNNHGLLERVILHEVAHVLAGARYGSNSHDPWFARIYLELIYTVLGSDTYLQLKDAFDHHGVDYDVDLGADRGGTRL